MKIRIRSVCFSLVTLLLLAGLTHTAYADTGATVTPSPTVAPSPTVTPSTFTYNTVNAVDKTIEITGYNGELGDLVIPKLIDGYDVVGIGDDAFLSSTTLKSIVIPDSVNYIGDNAFSNCANLTKVKFMGDAPTVGTLAFTNCSSELKVYYYSTKNGFDVTWNGLTTEAIVSVTGISIDKASASLLVGESLKLVSTLSPAEASNKNVVWTSSKPTVATVNTTGEIKALSEGSTVITVTTEDGAFKATCNINVYSLPAVPNSELAVAQNYDTLKLSWSAVTNATGYEVYYPAAIYGKNTLIATVQTNVFINSGLSTGTVYYYQVRAYRVVDGKTVYSDFTPVFAGKTLDRSIGSILFLYMSDLSNRNSVYATAVQLHNGDPSNTCVFTLSEALRRIGVNFPLSTGNTDQAQSNLLGRGWYREMDLSLLQPGDIGFTTDASGNKLGGHSTHTFIFMGWANKEKTLMNICDNQVGTYGSVYHARTIYNTPITDATAFFYHTNIASTDVILKLPLNLTVKPLSYNKVQISWGTAVAASGYNIYRATSLKGTYTNIGSTTGTSFIDAKVTPGKTYYYKVKAYGNAINSKVYGNYTNTISVKTNLPAPAKLKSKLSKGRAKLSWNGVSGSGYQIYRAKSQKGSYIRLTSTTRNYFTNSGLKRGKTYYYKVRAYRTIGKTKVYSGYSTLKVKAL